MAGITRQPGAFGSGTPFASTGPVIFEPSTAGRGRPRKGTGYNGQDHRHRPGYHQLGGRRHGRRRAHGHRQFGGRPHHPLGRRLRKGRRAPGRAGRPAAGHHQPREYRLLDQAVHGNALRRGRGRAPARPLRRRARQQRPGRGQPSQRRQVVHPARAVRGHPAEDAANGRGLSRHQRDRGGDHRSRVLQRRAAAGHQGRRQDRRARGQAHHQRAHGGRAGLRAGQEEGREDRRLRPRGRHLRHLDPGDRGRRLRGEGDQRRHAPRRGRLRPGADRLARGRVQEGPGDRSVEGLDGAAAAQGGRREGQDGAVVDRIDRHQPALHHRDPGRSQAPQLLALAGEVRTPGGRPDPAHHPADAQGAGGRRNEAGRHR